MTNRTKWSMIALSLMITFAACDKDDEEPMDNSPSTKNLTLEFDGLEDLGNDFRYEGWIMVNGSPVSTGVFSVDANGLLSQSTFNLNANDVDVATAFILTIEPHPDTDSGPSDVHVLAGDFSTDNADLVVGHPAALGDDFANANGGYILATPTDGMDNNENSGIWFLDPTAGPGAALELPTLPAGWAYEGWVVIDGIPVTTGTFTDIASTDDAAPYSGSMGGPPFPGEDFLNNAPAGLTFPTDLAGRTAVISIEPVPDNSSAPFTLKPLAADIPADALDHTLYSLNNNSSGSFPTGSASR